MDKPGHILGRNLKRILEAQGISDTELAQAAGISQAYVSKLKNGGVEEPGLGLSLRLASALGVPLSALVDSAALDLPLPLPAVYYQKRHQLTNPAFVEFLERLAEVMADHERGIERRDDAEGKPERGRRLVGSAAYRLFDQVIAQALAKGKAGAEAGRDAGLDEIAQRWSELSAEQQEVLIALVRQMARLKESGRA